MPRAPRTSSSMLSCLSYPQNRCSDLALKRATAPRFLRLEMYGCRFSCCYESNSHPPLRSILLPPRPLTGSRQLRDRELVVWLLRAECPRPQLACQYPGHQANHLKNASVIYGGRTQHRESSVVVGELSRDPFCPCVKKGERHNAMGIR